MSALFWGTHEERQEQQMKLHIECLQEKLESAMKDQKKVAQTEKEMEDLRKELQTFVDLSRKVEQDAIKIQDELA